MYILTKNVLHITTCRKATVEGQKYEKFSDISDITGIKACRCCKEPFQRYCEMKQTQDMHTNFVGVLKQYTDLYSYKVNILANRDVEIITAVEKWVIHFIKLIDERTAKIALYHRSTRADKRQKCGGSLYPEYHVQYTKTQTPKEVVMYTHGHELGKYGVTETMPFTATKKLGEK